MIAHSLVFHTCRVLQRNKFCFHPKYLCYLEYFQKRNSLFGCHLMFPDWNIGMQKLYLKNVFYSLKTTHTEFNSFLLLWALRYIIFLFTCHIERSYRKLYSRAELMFSKLKTTFLSEQSSFYLIFSHLVTKTENFTCAFFYLHIFSNSILICLF